MQGNHLAIVFNNFGIKTVTKTDRSKGAYVPTASQVAAIESAGNSPAVTRPAPDFAITVLNDPTRTTVNASYYYSQRSAAAARPPEPRMGHELITAWLKEGDTVLIGNVGSVLFAEKIAVAPLPAVPAAGAPAVPAPQPAAPPAPGVVAAAAAAMTAAIVAKAKAATGKPAKKNVTRKDYARNTFVVAAVIMRADGACEMPGCTCGLFTKADDSPYLEVHHVIPLAEGGDDTLANAAALCPHHHRALHHSKDKAALRATLAAHIATLVF